MVSVIVKSRVGPVSGSSVLSAKLQRPTLYRQASQRRSLRVQSRSTSGGPEDPRQTDLLQQLRAEATRFTEVMRPHAHVVRGTASFLLD